MQKSHLLLQVNGSISLETVVFDVVFPSFGSTGSFYLLGSGLSFGLVFLMELVGFQWNAWIFSLFNSFGTIETLLVFLDFLDLFGLSVWIL